MNNEREFDLLPLLDHIDPSILSYQEWVNVGMALKHEGYTAFDWDEWSLRDPAHGQMVLPDDKGSTNWTVQDNQTRHG